VASVRHDDNDDALDCWSALLDLTSPPATGLWTQAHGLRL
jgi:hypothetical protein